MTLSDSQRKALYKWQKKGTTVITMRLQNKGDADILEYFDNIVNEEKKVGKQTIIKAALREYMINHPSAVQPTAEEKN